MFGCSGLKLPQDCHPALAHPAGGSHGRTGNSPAVACPATTQPLGRALTLTVVGVLHAYRGLLSNRPLIRLLAGEFVSSIGDWLYLVALLVLVYAASGDPVLLGVVGAARVLPYVVLSVPAGIVADRFERRRVLLVTDLARGLLMLAMAWLVASRGPLWAIVVLAVAATCFSTFFGPTLGAYLPSLVRDERELGPANSAWSTLDNLAFVIGPAIAGLLIAASGLTLAFLLNALSFGVVAVVLWRLPAEAGRVERGWAPGAAAVTPIASSPASAGIDLATARPTTADPAAAPPVVAPVAGPVGPSLRPLIRPLAGLALADVTSGFVFGGLGVLTVILSVDRLGAGDAGTGLLNAAVGVGGVLGALGSGAFVVRPGLRGPLILGALGMAAGVALLGVATTMGPALAAMAIAAAGSLLTEVVSTTIFQRIVPDQIRGRALGAIATVSTLAYAAGSLALPILASVVGVERTMVGSALAVVVGVGLAALVVGSGADRAPAAEVAAAADRAASLPLFAGVPEARLSAAFARAIELPLRAGQAVIRQGDPADRFYIILEGALEVSQQASPDGPALVLRKLGTDEVFGEIGLLRSAPRSATVTAQSDGRLLAMDAADFLDLVRSGADLGPRLLALHRGGSVSSVGTNPPLAQSSVEA